MNEILLVEATEQFQTLSRDLESSGFRVLACTADEAIERLAAGDLVDALVINMMDGADAPAVRKLTEAKQDSARHATIAIVRLDQVSQLDPELSLDDFAVHPMATEELVARLRRAISRRDGEDSSHLLRCGDLTIDQASYQVFVGSRAVDLTYKEYELLRFLALNQDRVCTRETLLSQVWGYDFYGGGRTVDVHIRRVRSKIEDAKHSLIETVRNVGYRLRAG